MIRVQTKPQTQLIAGCSRHIFSFASSSFVFLLLVKRAARRIGHFPQRTMKNERGDICSHERITNLPEQIT